MTNFNKGWYIKGPINEEDIILINIGAPNGGEYFSHLMWRADSLEKTLMLGKIEGRSRSRQQTMKWLDGITISMGMNLSKLWKIVKDRETWHADVYGARKSQTPLSDWTTTKTLTSHWHEWTDHPQRKSIRHQWSFFFFFSFIFISWRLITL